MKTMDQFQVSLENIIEVTYQNIRKLCSCVMSEKQTLQL